MTDPWDDFYVGYQAQAPPDLGRWLRRLVIVLLLAVPLAAGLMILLQRPFADSVFEYGNVQAFEGRLTQAPYPALRITSPLSRTGQTLVLVSYGTRGADDRAVGLAGHRVRATGQLIYRDETMMLELADGPIEDLGPTSDSGESPSSLGEHYILGEIVDSKCHLGVMKPGEGKPHRACAARCISGGSPPMLWARDSAGNSRQYLLVGRDGRQLNREVLELVAEPVGISGEVVRQDGLWLLRAEPAEIRRLERDVG